MADQDNLNLEDVGVGTEEVGSGERKVGFLPAFIIRILRWVAIGLGFVLLGVTTVIITMRIVGRNEGNAPLDLVSPKMVAKMPPLSYFDSIDSIRGVTTDDPPAVFTMQVSLGFRNEDKTLAVELSARQRQIENLLLTTISRKSRSELTPEYYGLLQDELKIQINKLLADGQIHEVVFRQFMVTQ